MRLGLRLSASLLLLTASLAAHADTAYFNFTGNGVDNFSFSAPAHYDTNGGNGIGFYINNVAVDLNGVTSDRQIGFYTPVNLGGLTFTSATHAYEFAGPQIFIGDYYPPYGQAPGFYYGGAFILGTYTLHELNGDHLGTGTLVISDAPPATTSPVPEPSSLLLLGTGFLSTCAAIRRRLAL